MKKQTANERTKVHFAAHYLIAPTNPVTVNLIGAGGTGGRVITGLMEMHTALTAFGHPGLQVQLFDPDTVTTANLVRQRFADTELGMNKAVARINNINRWRGTNWKAIPYAYSKKNLTIIGRKRAANIFISCVDTVAARMEIAGILKDMSREEAQDRDRPYYWQDYGNSKDFGQVVLSTVSEVEQPASKKFQPVARLPFITDEYKDLLQRSETEDNTPSCSAQEALEKQELYINASLVPMGCQLLYVLFREALTENRGFFLNLKTYRTQPIKVT